jgi:hypothetical protein
MIIGSRMNIFALRSMAVVLPALFLVLAGCGGGGSGVNSGSGLGSGAFFSDSQLKVNFFEALNLSVSEVATDRELVAYQIRKPVPFQTQAPFSWSKELGGHPDLSRGRIEDLKASSQSIQAISYAVSVLRKSIVQFRVTITADDLLVPVIAYFPKVIGEVLPSSGSVPVPAGKERRILIEGIGVEAAKILVAAQATVDLDPSTITTVGGVDSNAPLQFEEVDIVAPITSILLATAGDVEGPHRDPVELILSTSEGDTLKYKVSEKNNANSILSAVTSGFISTLSTATVRLDQEGIYIFEFQSIDGAGNVELLNEKEITVDFNLNAPLSELSYSGSPAKFFAGAALGFSIQMQESETGTLNYTIGTEPTKTTTSLKNREITLVQVGIQGAIATYPTTVKISFSSQVFGGSAELSPRSTDLELTDISVNGSIVTSFEGAATSYLTSGVLPFCDTDSSSTFISQACSNQGKRVLLLTGPFSPGQAGGFSCLKLENGKLTVVDEGDAGVCQNCTRFKNQRGLDCP